MNLSLHWKSNWKRNDNQVIKELKTSPYIIAKKVHEYQSVRSYAEKYDLLEKIYAQVLRYFSCICLSEYLLDAGVHAKINLAINSLIRPSLGVRMVELSSCIHHDKIQGR